MEKISDLLPFLVPILLLELILLVVALTDLVRRDHVRGPKWMWVLVIVLFNILGPVAYLLWGRLEGPRQDIEDPLFSGQGPHEGEEDSRWGEG